MEGEAEDTRNLTRSVRSTQIGQGLIDATRPAGRLYSTAFLAATALATEPWLKLA